MSGIPNSRREARRELERPFAWAWEGRRTQVKFITACFRELSPTDQREVLEKFKSLLEPELPGLREERLKRKRSGYVYFMKSGSLWKIGRSRDPQRRLKSLTISVPDLQIEHQIRCFDSLFVESEIHRFWHRCRVKGEWFKIPDSIVLRWKRVRYIPENFQKWDLFLPPQ